MKSTHHFNLELVWDSTKTDSLNSKYKTIKNHIVKIVGKEDLNVSAAKAFKGDATLYNPEDLLLASLTSCHMMSYLYCCAQHKLDVLSYEDHAEAILEVNADGSGRIVKVILKPVVRIKDSAYKSLATALHVNANQLCFIANSCNFPIEHEVQIVY